MSKYLVSGCAFALVLGSFATISHALMPSHTLNADASLTLPIADVEGEAVEQELDPQEVTPPPESAAPSQEGEGSTDVENQAIKKEIPELDLPPDEK
jgi:hypothetical protein